MSATEQKKSHEHKSTFDAASPMHAMMSVWQKEALRVADETEKAVERGMQEFKRATHEGGRMFEAQLELSASMNRAAFDSVRRMWNFV